VAFSRRPVGLTAGIVFVFAKVLCTLEALSALDFPHFWLTENLYSVLEMRLLAIQDVTGNFRRVSLKHPAGSNWSADFFD
jgi:hypothetical protein